VLRASSSCALGTPEDRHDGVADEFLDGAAMRSQDLAEFREGMTKRRPDDLRIVVLTELGRTDDVREDDGYEFSLFGHIVSL
jgi:hypothetical protein